MAERHILFRYPTAAKQTAKAIAQHKQQVMLRLSSSVCKLGKQGRAVGWPAISHETCVVNKRAHGGHLLSLILKRHNQKKINSHEWGFRAFAQMSQCSYLLTSDCGTLFDPKCVRHLFDYMEANEGAVACTGRQRVMSSLQQAERSMENKGLFINDFCNGWEMGRGKSTDHLF